MSETQNSAAGPSFDALFGAPEGKQDRPWKPSPQARKIASNVQAFAADPAHPRFEQVRNTMAYLLVKHPTGMTLKRAYDMACLMVRP